MTTRKVQTREQAETFLQEHCPNVKVVATDRGTEINAVGNGVCDFCSVPLQSSDARVYDVPDFRLPARTKRQQEIIGDYVSEGGWGACPDCERFVDANDSIGLLEHAVKNSVSMKLGASEQQARSALLYAHTGFWAAYAVARLAKGT